AGMEEEAELVSGCDRRQDDPAPSTALHVQARRRESRGERGKPRYLRVAAGRRCFTHQAGSASLMEASATAAGSVSPAAGEPALGHAYMMIQAVCRLLPFRRRLVAGGAAS